MAYKKTNKEKRAEAIISSSLFSSTKFSYLLSNSDRCNIISMKGGFQK